MIKIAFKRVTAETIYHLPKGTGNVMTIEDPDGHEVVVERVFNGLEAKQIHGWVPEMRHLALKPVNGITEMLVTWNRIEWVSNELQEEGPQGKVKR